MSEKVVSKTLASGVGTGEMRGSVDCDHSLASAGCAEHTGGTAEVLLHDLALHRDEGTLPTSPKDS